MKKLIPISFLTFLVIVICAAAIPRNESDLNDLSSLNWLEGKWKGTHGNGNFVEVWSKKDEESFKGTGYYIAKGETLSSEHLEIRKIENYLVYISVAGNQAPILFTLIKNDNRTWVFENKEHDFPQRIVYSNKKENELLAWIEGVEDGKPNKKEFLMKRVH